MKGLSGSFARCGAVIVFLAPILALILLGFPVSAAMRAPLLIGEPIGVNILISQSSTGVLGHPGSYNPTISANGKLVAFSATVGNLVPNDNNATDDVFVHDWESGVTERISVSSAGAQGNGQSRWAQISADGRFVVYSSLATNLVITDTNNVLDVFYRNLETDSTVRVSTSPTGTQGNNASWYGSISADGKLVVFASLASNLVGGDTNVKQDVFVRNMDTGDLKRISVNNSGVQGNGDSKNPSISGDGNFVAFESSASNLVENDANGQQDVFVYDLQTDTIVCASVRPDGLPGNSASFLGSPKATANLSDNGSLVVFVSYATNLVSGDTNGKIDAFARDLEYDVTERISVSSGGVQGDQNTENVTISADGQFAAFSSSSTTFETGDTNTAMDVFIRDLSGGETHLASLSNEGRLGNAGSIVGTLSSTGRYLVYTASASNLLGGGVSSFGQVLLFDPLGVDLQLESIKPVQVLEDEDLVLGKSTAIKAVVRKLGAQQLTDVVLSATSDGDTTYTFYVDEPSNNNPDGSLIGDMNAHMLSFNTSEITKTVYLVGDALTPDGLLSYSVDVRVDPLEDFSEMNERNNLKTASKLVADLRYGYFPDLDVAFLPLDWGPAADPDEYETYSIRSSDFLQGVFPVSEDRYQMHLWHEIYSTEGSRDSYGKLTQGSLALWVRWTNIKLRLAHPTVDRFVAVVPWGWFDQILDDPSTIGLLFYYSGLALTEVRLGDDLSSYNIPTHEIAHSYGLRRFSEEYVLANPGYLAAPGFWVEKRLPVDGDPIRYCFMSARSSPQTYGFWVDREDYEKLILSVMTASPESKPQVDPRAILASGTVDTLGNATLDDWYLLPEAEVMDMPEGEYTFVYLDAADAVLGEHKVDFWIEGVEDWEELPFSVMIPYLEGTTRIELRHSGSTLAQKTISASPPVVQITAPAGGETFFIGAPLAWTASDPDEDPLSYAVLYSSDGGTSWTTAAIGIETETYDLNFNQLPPGTNYLVRVIATDGVNTGEDVSDAPFTVLGSIFLPVVRR